MKKFAAIFLSGALALSAGYSVLARGGGHSSGSHSSGHYSSGSRSSTRGYHSSGRPYSSRSYHYSRSHVYSGARFSSRGYYSFKGYHSSGSSFGGRRATYSYGVQRDANGHIERSSEAKYSFMAQTGYPHGRPGYVVDHIVPLKRGGPDEPSNMQWQTVAEAKAKDRWE
jgi:hypothetical protein